MKLLSQLVLLTLLIIFNGCATKEQAKQKIDETLSVVGQIKNIVDVNSVAFEWQIAKEAKVVGYYLYRGVDINALKRVSKIDDRFSSHYVDKSLEPDTTYFYRIASFDKDGFESPPSQTIQTRTLKPLQSVSYIQAISNLPRKVKLIWRPHESPRVKSYLIERNDFSNAEWKQIVEVSNRLQVEYIDADLKDDYTYYYRIKIKTFDDIISLPSIVVKAVTKPLLAEVRGLSATTSEPFKIVLNWEAESSKDFDYYNIYISDSVDGDFKIYKKQRTTTFEDKIKQSGVVKFYKISVVDKDGLESTTTPAVMGSTLEAPKTPAVKVATIKNNEAVISWDSKDDRVKSFIVYKKVKDGWASFKTYKFVNIEDTMFKDRDILPNVEYIYTVSSIDSNGIISKESEEIKLFMSKDR